MGFKLNKLCEKAKVEGIEKQVLSKLCDHASEKNNYNYERIHSHSNGKRK